VAIHRKERLKIERQEKKVDRYINGGESDRNKKENITETGQ